MQIFIIIYHILAVIMKVRKILAEFLCIYDASIVSCKSFLMLVNAADVVLVIRRDRVDIYCNPINYVYLLPLVAHWRRLRIHCLPQAQVTNNYSISNNNYNNYYYENLTESTQ